MHALLCANICHCRAHTTHRIEQAEPCALHAAFNLPTLLLVCHTSPQTALSTPYPILPPPSHHPHHACLLAAICKAYTPGKAALLPRPLGEALEPVTPPCTGVGQPIYRVNIFLPVPESFPNDILVTFKNGTNDCPAALLSPCRFRLMSPGHVLTILTDKSFKFTSGHVKCL
jgi:hypothetical protein